jgi:hypothetical protein
MFSMLLHTLETISRQSSTISTDMATTFPAAWAYPAVGQGCEGA